MQGVSKLPRNIKNFVRFNSVDNKPNQDDDFKTLFKKTKQLAHKRISESKIWCHIKNDFDFSNTKGFGRLYEHITGVCGVYGCSLVTIALLINLVVCDDFENGIYLLFKGLIVTIFGSLFWIFVLPIAVCYGLRKTIQFLKSNKK